MLFGSELICLFKQIAFDWLLFFVFAIFEIVLIEVRQKYLSLHPPLDTIGGVNLNSSL